MSYTKRETAFIGRVRLALEECGGNYNAEIMAETVKQLAIILPYEIKVLAREHRGWYTASSLYEAVYREPIPSQSLAVRLGHQLREAFPTQKKIGPQRYYWIAPEGVRPLEQIGVS